MNNTLQRSPSGNMDIQRMFGHVKADSYSPSEYARTLGPIIEQKLRTGPIASSNSSLSPGHKGVQLTIVCERSFLVRTQKGADANTVLHESGKPAQSDFNQFIGGLFESAKGLTSVTLQDALGNLHTLKREDIPAQQQSLAEVDGGSLDLSALYEGGGVATEASQKDADAAFQKRKTATHDKRNKAILNRGKKTEAIQSRAISDAVELVKAAGFKAPISVQSKGPDFWKITAKGSGNAESVKSDISNEIRAVKSVEVFSGSGNNTSWVLISGPAQGSTWKLDTALSESGGPPENFSQAPLAGALVEGRVNQNHPSKAVKSGDGWQVMVWSPTNKKYIPQGSPHSSESAAKKDAKSFDESGSLSEDVVSFLGERADFIGAAERLLRDSELDRNQHNQEGLGYRAYLRQVVTKKDPGYLTKSEDRDIRNGALKARKDVIDLAGTMTTENLAPLAEASTLVPAYGRDYKSKAAVIADFNAGKDFIISDISSRWDGKPANKEDLEGTGQRSVNIRFNSLRSVAVVPIA